MLYLALRNTTRTRMDGVAYLPFHVMSNLLRHSRNIAVAVAVWSYDLCCSKWKIVKTKDNWKWGQILKENYERVTEKERMNNERMREWPKQRLRTDLNKDMTDLNKDWRQRVREWPKQIMREGHYHRLKTDNQRRT